MILSISRRTDIPACYPQWILNRLEAGEVWVRNPRVPQQVSRVLFSPETVDCLVFWTKNPGPMLPFLSRLEALGYPFYFQHTLTPYGPDIEPGLPNKRQVLRDILAFGQALGPQRTVWRYDPVLLGGRWTVEAHLTAFSQLCRALEGVTDRCVISFLDDYPFLKKSIAGLRAPAPEEQHRMAAAFAEMGKAHGMTLSACAEGEDFSGYGIRPGACIDPERVALVSGRQVRATRDRNQRPLCGCAASIDVGAYNCCSHGCRYCYATQQPGRVAANMRLHDPDSPLLLGRPLPGDRVTVREK